MGMNFETNCSIYTQIIQPKKNLAYILSVAQAQRTCQASLQRPFSFFPPQHRNASSPSFLPSKCCIAHPQETKTITRGADCVWGPPYVSNASFLTLHCLGTPRDPNIGTRVVGCRCSKKGKYRLNLQIKSRRH